MHDLGKEGQTACALLMVSGGSDSTALLEMASAGLVPELADGVALGVLHVNHLLRGQDSDADQRFVEERCRQLGLDLAVVSVNVAAAATGSGRSIEEVARQERYRVAEQELDSLCRRRGVDPERGLIVTAHTLDDRVETFLMRSLVGTGPGGLGSIPRRRGRVLRPLLSRSREELRQWLRQRHPGVADEFLWRDDPTNDDGSNFRSQVRTQLVPVMRQLRPGFEHSLERTMDLIAQEDDACQQRADSFVYRNLSWDGREARLPIDALLGLDLPLLRRVLKAGMLVVSPSSRLESKQIDRVAAGLRQEGFAAEVDGGVRVMVGQGRLRIFVAQVPKASCHGANMTN